MVNSRLGWNVNRRLKWGGLKLIRWLKWQNANLQDWNERWNLGDEFCILAFFFFLLQTFRGLLKINFTTVHLWCGGHSTSISACGVWGARVGI